MALAMERGRLEEPAVALVDVLRSEPLTVAEAVQLAEALLAAPGGPTGFSAAGVVVTESGAIKLLAPAGDLSSSGRLLCAALGIQVRGGPELSGVERAAPGFVSCLRALASGSFTRADAALEALIEAAGAAASESARIRARQRLRLRARQARPIGRAVDVVVQPALPRLEQVALPARFPGKSRHFPRPTLRFPGKSLRPTPVVAATFVTAVLAVAFLAIGAKLPSEPSVPRATNPAHAVWLVFDLGSQHRYDEASALRSGRLQASDPAGRSFRDRFATADRMQLVQERVVAFDRIHGRATVDVVWTERSAKGVRLMSGQVYLVNSSRGWLWDGGTVA